MFHNSQSRFRPVLTADTGGESNLNRATRLFYSKTVDTSKLVRERTPKASLRLQNKKVLELSFVITLFLLIGGFQAGRQFALSTVVPDKVDITIEVEDIPLTQQLKLPPPPARPAVPIPTEDEAVPEDLTIATTEINLSDIPPPPPPPDEEDDLPIFFAYDEPPEIVGGLASLQRYLKYPRLAQAAGIEGIVFVKVLVGTDGKTEHAEILQAKPSDMGFEESAIEALHKVKWVPARQRDKKIRVWVSIPVHFKLVS